MKKVLPLVLLFAVLIYILPLAALFFPSGKNEESGSGTAPAPSASAPPVTDGTQAPSAPQPGTSAADDAEPPLLILDENTGEVAEVSVRDFVRGAVAAEMPMTYPDEALRAQAVAAHSYALAVKAQADPDNEALKGAYFSANHPAAGLHHRGGFRAGRDPAVRRPARHGLLPCDIRRKNGSR